MHYSVPTDPLNVFHLYPIAALKMSLKVSKHAQTILKHLKLHIQVLDSINVLTLGLKFAAWP